MFSFLCYSKTFLLKQSLMGGEAQQQGAAGRARKQFRMGLRAAGSRGKSKNVLKQPRGPWDKQNTSLNGPESQGSSNKIFSERGWEQAKEQEKIIKDCSGNIMESKSRKVYKNVASSLPKTSQRCRPGCHVLLFLWFCVERNQFRRQ